MATDDTLLSELEGDVPSLANLAATELDNILLDRGEEVSAIQRFVNLLKEELGGSQDATARRMPVKATTFVVMNRAVSEAKLGRGGDNVGDVIRQIGQVVDTLEKIAADPLGHRKSSREDLDNMRSFCLAYSKSASASRRSRSTRTKNPFRK